MNQTDFLSRLRPAAASVPFSGISTVFKHGYGRAGLIPLWVGEGDLATPDFIVEAARRSLGDGDTFYTLSAGHQPLRQALADYHTRIYGRLFGRDFPADRFLVTGSGMQAIQIAVAAIAGAGDEVLVPTPAWPNFLGVIHVGGARAVEVPMTFIAEGSANSGWHLDFARLEAAVTERTRAIVVNSPSNPTGWTASRDDLAALLDFARRAKIWIIADEVYHRFYFGPGGVAPSFHPLIGPDDAIVFCNTFSKNWAMTGWRLGWIEAPPAIAAHLENMIQYSTSCSPLFVQKAAVAALSGGEPFIARQVSQVGRNRDLVAAAFAAREKLRFALPQGAFYLFFAIDGEADTERLAVRLVDEANIGVAPGATFGGAGREFVRICLARAEDDMHTACDRLLRWVP